MKLLGRSAVITGANQGLGKAIAEQFVRAGASVLLTARNDELLAQAEQELRSLAGHPGQHVHRLAGDVARPECSAAVVGRAKELFGGLTILVNNAGLLGPLGPIEEVDWAEWAQNIQVNLLGTALMCRSVIPLFRAAGYGKIINLSGGGATSPMPRLSAYAASKAAVVRLTETLAHELHDVGVDVNAIAPGALNTRLLDEVLAAGPDRVGRAFYERHRKLQAEGGVPLERGASLVVFLASADSDGISGRLISAVWDDWAALPDQREQLANSDVYTLRRIVPQDRGLEWKAA
jgi:3-oxoacyl-[acyl-carrier protein] reductase